MGAPFKAVVVHLQYPSRSSYFDDWLDAFCAVGFESLNLFSSRELRKKKESIEDADLIVVLHSATANNLIYLERSIPFLDRRKCPMVVFVGNEFNAHSNHMHDKRRLIHELGTDVVATQMLEETGRWLYSDVCSQVIGVPHALNPNAFLPGSDLMDRRVKIGIRAGLYPALLGDDERNRLLERLTEMSRADSSIDISMDCRLSRSGWGGFLQGAQSTFSTEAGSWFLDRDDEIMRRIEATYGVKKGVSTRTIFYRLGQRLPWRVKGIAKRLLRANQVNVMKNDSEEEDPLSLHALQRRFFTEDARCPYYSKCISSRHFDAIGTKTVQVLMEGRYNDILVAGKHYIPMRRDLEDLDEVVKELSDVRQFQPMVDEAYEYALDAHTHSHRVAGVLNVLGMG